MIRLLAQDDRDVALSYLGRDPLNNIYLIHALNTYGLCDSRVAFWGSFGGTQLDGLLFLDGDGVTRAGYLAGDRPEALARLGKRALDSGAKALVGKRSYVEHAMKNLKAPDRGSVKPLKLYRLSPENVVRYHDYAVRMATENDIPLLVELYRGYEFSLKDRTDKEIEREIRQAMRLDGVYFVLESDERIVCAARVFPETDQAGMIGAARTFPAYRGRRMYPSVRTACLEYLFRQEKTGVGLILDTNASMLKVNERQGGVVVAEWLIAELKVNQPLRRRVVPVCLRRWGLRARDRVLQRLNPGNASGKARREQ
jgi:hypothetical protein